MRSIAVTAAVAASLTLTGPAFADADITFPDEHAACVAQAWVPANTSPDEQPGDLRVGGSSATSPTPESGAT